MYLGFNGDEKIRLTWYLIAVNVVVFIIQMLVPWFDGVFSLTPVEALSGSYWQFVTYMFLHGSVLHIFFNMFALLIFGSVMERVLGYRKFIALYFITGIASAGFFIMLSSLMGDSLTIPLLGASGAVFGVLAAYAFKYPKNWVFMFGVIPLPAAVLLVVLLAEETFFGLLSLEPGIANFGHVGGIISGIAIMALWRYTGKPRRARDFKDFEFVWE